MMEESTEPHMETDVSSTTDDVPETQEVTGSDGNVEMIIVVEKMDEELDADDQIEEQPSLVTDDTNNVSTQEKKSSENDPKSQKNSPLNTPTKTIAISEANFPIRSQMVTPNINADNLSIPSHSEVELMIIECEPEQEIKKSPLVETQKVETADLSMKVPLLIQSEEKLKKDVQKPIQKSPIKDLQSQESVNPSPTKDSDKPSTTKELTKFSPMKESAKPSPIKESSKLSPMKESAKLSPMKESVKPLLIKESTSSKQSPKRESPKPSPIKDLAKSSTTKESTKPSPIKESAKPSPTKESAKPPVIKELAKSSPMKESVKPLPTKESAKPPAVKEMSDKITVNGKVHCNDSSKLDDTNAKNITSTMPIDITIETSNDSQIETLSDISEKEHKSISRELKSLINSAKESKIISECTQLTSKTRKSRTGLDTSSSSLNSSLLEPSKVADGRRSSDNSQKSNCSEKSDKVVLKRSMRSQNPEFVSKVKQFLNSVTGKGHKDSEDEEDEVEEKVYKDKTELNEPINRGTPPKVKKIEHTVTEKSNKLRSDSYCWRCHWVVEQVTNEKLHPPMHCTVCPRSFHYKCLTSVERSKINLEKNWVCPECMLVLQAESSETRSQAMKKISLGMLCELLKHALERMMDLNGVEPFLQPVDRTAFPDYDKYVVHPMDLSLMKDNIAEGLYGSTEAFLADAQWILHNSIIFNTLQSKLTAGARALVRSCRAEMGEIEACPECYAAAHARRPTWFTDVCTTPHILFWAKLKGFPYWPAKGMSVNSSGLVDVRFFGAHDRAWVPAKDCFLYCERDPNNFRTKRQDIIDSMQEAEQHIRNISRKYGRFVYPPFKTQFDPTKMNEQLKMMIPAWEGEVKSLVKYKPTPVAAKEKSRSNSKSSKSSFNDGSVLLLDSSESDGEELQRLYSLLDEHSDTSDNEDDGLASRKMADGAEIAKVDEDDSAVDKDNNMETETAPIKVKEDFQNSTSTTSSRKRRRSELEEAVITIIETSGTASSAAKRRKIDEDATDTKKPEEKDTTTSKTDDKPQTIDQSKEVTNEDTQAKTNETPPKAKDTDSSTSTDKENQRVTPIRIALVSKDKRHTTRNSSAKEATAKIITPTKDKDSEKTPQRQKSSRTEKVDKTPSTKTEKVDKTPSSKTDKVDKTPSTKTDKVEKTPSTKTDKVDKTPTAKADKTPVSKPERVEKTPSSKSEKTSSDKTAKEDRSRAEKRSSSRSSRSTNSNSSTRSSDKPDRKVEKTTEANSNKDKSKESASAKEKDKNAEAEKSTTEKQTSPKPTEVQSPKTVKDRLQFDDDTTLAVLARETSNSTITTISNNSGLPTISCVRSLSTTAQNTSVIVTKTTTIANTIDITEEASSDSSIFTPTSTENVKTMKDAVTKLQRLRNDAEPVVGRVGVRAFARMTSPERQSKNDEVQVEIKAEPMDLDDPERHMEKMDLMNAFRLRPVNPSNPPQPPMNLRDVRINKVVVTPLNARKAAVKPAEVRPRAKKSFPQPKKPEDGQLNSKNSMVYIPIQPPMTQAPVRLPRPQLAAPQLTAPPNVTSVLRTPLPVSTAVSVNNAVNTVSTSLTPVSQSVAACTASTVSVSSSVAAVPTVHTVPLMTSVNGQWMFSFQPVMSVGAIDSGSSPPVLNGVPERGGSLAPCTVVAGPPAAPAAAPAPPVTVITRTPDNTLGEPPRLQQRPAQLLLNPLDPNTPIGSVPPPSTAGPVTAKLNQNAVKMTDFFRSLLEDTLEKLDEPLLTVTSLRLQLEQANWRHQQEIKELKHNHELMIAEMRGSFDKEKLRAVSEARRTAQAELEAVLKLAKSKQWCANCSQEAQFYCCWNTSYCDYPCQRAHWSQHFSVCQQRSQDGTNGEAPSSPENRLQPQPELPKKSSAPTLTVGGKVAPSRTFTQDPHSTQKTSIIVSMVEDTSGNQTMKCVGTYKASPPGQIAPIIINKQLMNNEENASKKVVSSTGGYLIVGASNSSSVVTPARRSHTIQYYT